MAGSSFPSAIPGIGSPIVNPNVGDSTQEFYSFLLSLYTRTNTNPGVSAVLDALGNTQGSLLYRGQLLWQTLPLGTPGKLLEAGASAPEWAFLTGANFSPQAKNLFLAGPTSGGTATPTFRDIASADLDPLLGQYPGIAGNTAASSGNIGEYISNSNTAALTSGSPADVASISLSPGDWDVWANFSTSPAAGTTTSVVRAWINTVSATDPGPPNGGAYLLLQETFGAALAQVSPVGMMRISINAGATAFLSANVTFAGGTLSGGGFIGARRTH
jgi:hypothetical protein